MLHWATKEELRKEFTHKGWLLFCPIYADVQGTEDDPLIGVSERNGIPVVLLFATVILVRLGVWLLNFGGLSKAFPTDRYPIWLTSEL